MINCFQLLLSISTCATISRYLKHCGNCPARGARAWYCGAECQRADWVPRHKGECAEGRRARQAAGAKV